MLKTKGTLPVPCMLEAMITALEVGVKAGTATDDDAGGEEETTSGVEDPVVGAGLELAGTAADELGTPGLEEFAGETAEELVGINAEELGGITAEELAGTTAEEFGPTTAEELEGVITPLLGVEFEAPGAVGVVVLLDVAGEDIVVELVVEDVAVLDADAVVCELVVAVELLVGDSEVVLEEVS